MCVQLLHSSCTDSADGYTNDRIQEDRRGLQFEDEGFPRLDGIDNL